MPNRVNHNDTLRNQFLRNLPHDLALVGQHAALEPLQTSHVEELVIAAADGELWNLQVTTVPSAQGMLSFVEDAIRQRDSGQQLPFAIRRTSDNRVVGSTRYYQISPTNRNLSIGYTWYSKSAQRSGINTECKLMLLRHAFEATRCISVQWHTHHENLRSQAAILRLGAQFEGVLRNDRIMPDGSIRHTHCYSMLDTEWENSKAFLLKRLAAHC